MEPREKSLNVNIEKKGNEFRRILIENPHVQFVTKYFLLFALIFIVGIIGIIDPNFLNVYNMLNILKTASILGLISLAAMINLNSGTLNFCLGTQSTLTAAVIAILLERYTDNYILAVLAGFAGGMFVGWVCYFFIVILKGPSFIVTLSLSSILYAINMGLAGGTELFSSNWPSSYTLIGRTKLFHMIPLPIVIFAVLGAMCWFMMERTRLGRHLYACGANVVTSRQIGISLGKLKLYAFMIGSFLTATAGLVETSVLNSVNLTTGNDLLIPAISSAMLGTTFLTPGRYNVLGTMIAAFLMTIIKIGVAGLGAGSFLSDIANGIILVIAVGFISLVREEGLPKVGLT